MATGITKRHSRKSRSREGGGCNCEPSFEAWVYSRRDHKKIRAPHTFARESEARSWRGDAFAALGKGTLRAPSSVTVAEAWRDWYAAARAGTVRNDSRDTYKPSSLRAYEAAMRLRVLPALGHVRLVDVQARDLQQLVDRLLTEGLNPSTIGTTLLPLRAIYRRACGPHGELAINPTTGLEMPAVRGRRERFASAEEAEKLVAAVPIEDRAAWATAFFGGLRQGELRALRTEDVDVAAGVIRVARGWDPVEGEIELKSNAGRRKVPIAAVLRDHLTEHLARRGRYGQELVFGRTAAVPFGPKALQDRADSAWKAAGLDRITFHECRHSFASLMIAAGVNAKALSTFMGHANISITLDRYGHLLPGSEEEAAGMLDTYLAAQRERAEDAARAAGSELTGAHTGAQLGEEIQEVHV